MIPLSDCHMKPQRTATTKLGTTQGARMSVRTTLIPRICRLSSTAIASPPPSVPRTVKNVYWRVLPTASMNPECRGFSESKRIER